MKRFFLLIFIGTNLLGQSSIEKDVLDKVREVFQEQGSVTFSTLYNSDRFTEEQKQFLGRLYETFFAIPGFLKASYSSTGHVPTRDQIGKNFNLSVQSIDLLLAVMERDSRVPQIYTRDDGTREIRSLNLPAIEAFQKARGSQVKISGWEGKRLPSFEVRTLENRSLSDQDIRGFPTLIYFWFSGCPPCVQIAPILADLDQSYRSRGFRFVGINADTFLEIPSTQESKRAYLEKQGITFVNGELNKEMRESFGNINVYPALFFVAKNGTIFKHLVNFQPREKLEATITAMLSAD